MRKKQDYLLKFASFTGKTIYEKLPSIEQALIRRFAFNHRLTFQEFRQLVEASRDLSMWDEGGLDKWWRSLPESASHNGKEQFLSRLKAYMTTLRVNPKRYHRNMDRNPLRRTRKEVLQQATDNRIYGMCPVASEKTVCCNLRTIDVVENCVFGCSYCTIQTFYTEHIHIQQNIAEKLDQIVLDPNRFYHFGTGQASDSLAWGNRDGILDTLFQYARKHPNILMEFKTKSKNIQHFLENQVPVNVVCSWSLNPEEVIEHEEHFTASLSERLSAARTMADRGIKLAFHFHPMVYYEGWENAYGEIAEQIIQGFHPDEVLFISFGSVTLIKPVIQKIRNLGNPTKILQMELVPDPHGKLTYPDDIKIKLFRLMYEKFVPWHALVFFYLCMEKAEIWQAALNYVYPSNEAFEQDFGRHTMCKIGH